jgi:response regulator RpfG family c-di-GMP phosphodiesterase
VLRRHAHRYSVRTGDGEALASRLLQESGISEPIERAVALAGIQAVDDADHLRGRWKSDEQFQLQQLSEQLASVQRAVLDRALMMKAITELARYVRSPAVQRLANQYAEVAELSRLARAVSDAVQVPEIELREPRRDST